MSLNQPKIKDHLSTILAAQNALDHEMLELELELGFEIDNLSELNRVFLGGPGAVPDSRSVHKFYECIEHLVKDHQSKPSYEKCTTDMPITMSSLKDVNHTLIRTEADLDNDDISLGGNVDG